MQSLQDRVPRKYRHGKAQIRVSRPLQRAARGPLARPRLRQYRGAEPHRLRSGSFVQLGLSEFGLPADDPTCSWNSSSQKASLVCAGDLPAMAGEAAAEWL